MEEKTFRSYNNFDEIKYIKTKTGFNIGLIDKVLWNLYCFIKEEESLPEKSYI